MVLMNIHTLHSLGHRQLRELWIEIGVRGEPPHIKQALKRGIAWHQQCADHGVIDAETRRLLKAAIRNAPLPPSQRCNQPIAHKQRDPLKLPDGTTLVRSWRGRKHEVQVLGDGKRFKYRDIEYASLSEIAREITGARWSGPRFFGLKKLKQPSKGIIYEDHPLRRVHPQVQRRGT
jgi:superfamily I DNA/RNA helicase